jgi:probable rRNA maturation factor
MKPTTVPEFDPDRAAPASPSAEPVADDEPPEPGPADAEASGEGTLSSSVALVLHAPETDPPLTGWIEPRFDQLLTLLGIREPELTIAVLGDEAMALVHEEYGHEPGTTDVLTFDMREAADEPFAGDILICRDVAERQAAQRGHATRAELLLYALHGLLHLLGYDDHDPADHAAMHRREDELLQAIGLGPLYHAGRPSEPEPNQ